MTTNGEFERSERWTVHKNSVTGEKKRKDKEIIYVVWYMHYQENTIVLGTTELQCLGESRGRVWSWVWQRPTGEFFVNWAGEKHDNEGELLCSGVGIKNSYKHQVQSADIDIIFGPMLKNWEVYDVNRGNAQAMAQSFRYWNISLVTDKCCILWYVMVVNVLFVLNMYLQSRVFQMILHIVLLLLKIKSNYIYKKTVCDYLI